ncbi:MAG: hypothetical protein LBG73_06490 [Spirochaetaceae bacterium]|jgi:hypothetical protein|nr:hypothetical protein [Spirochaetaceae bacterium]
MQKPLSLDELYTRYTLGDLTKREFEGCIFKHILTNYRQFYLSKWNKDQCADYLGGLYPRLSLAIDAYKNVGSSFEHYIKSKLYWFVKEVRSRSSDHRVAEYACWENRAVDQHSLLYYYESEYLETLFLESGLAKKSPAKTIPNPRQILILLLKSYFFVSDDFASRIAPDLGLTKKKLIQMLDALRKQRFDRDQEIRQLKDRLHSQYYRCISFEQRLKAVPEGSSHHEIMKGRLQRARQRYDSMKKRYASVNVEATNRQIADVLGIPKGTVDSNLYALKQKIKRHNATRSHTTESYTT